MTIRKLPPPRSGFAIDRLATVRTRRVSAEARGVLVNLLSRPDNWVVTASGVAREEGFGRAKAGLILKELEAAGYAKSTKTRDKRGQFVTDWMITDAPDGPGPEDAPKDEPELKEDQPSRAETPGLPVDDASSSRARESSPDDASSNRARESSPYRRTKDLRRIERSKTASHLRCDDRQEDPTVRDLEADPTPCLGADPPAAEDPLAAQSRTSTTQARKDRDLHRPTADPAPLSLNTAFGLAIYFQDQVDAKLGKQTLNSTNRSALAGNFAAWHRRDMTWVTIKKMIDTWVSRELGSELRLSVPPWRAFLAARYALQALVQKTAAPVMSAAEQADWDYALANQGPIRRVSA